MLYGIRAGGSINCFPPRADPTLKMRVCQTLIVMPGVPVAPEKSVVISVGRRGFLAAHRWRPPGNRRRGQLPRGTELS
jgi:hypothetical protein